MLSCHPLRFLQFRQGVLCREEGFRKETSLSGVKHHHVTGMYREDVLQSDGTFKRVRRCVVLGPVSSLSERSARKMFQPYLDRVNAAAKLPPKSGVTLEEFVKEWRASVAVNLKDSTTRTAESHLRAHILPMLGSLTLPEINTKAVQSFVAYLGTGRSRKTVENVLLTLSSILRTAKAWDYACGGFSLADITMPREAVKKEQRSFTDETRGRDRCRQRCAATPRYSHTRLPPVPLGDADNCRYLRRLCRSVTFALDRSMIPLGSCTMKLNATTEMLPVTWPEFASLHPFAPLDQAAGYLELIDDLERWLAEITGYDAVSLQPNAGSQGEYAGLLAIRKYHAERGDAHREVCLIPASAHGTNAASAAMAGLRVVVVKTDEHGNVDIDDLKAKVVEHADRPVRSWSPTRRRTASSRRRSPTCARSCTTTAGRSTSTAPTSTRSSASRSPGASVPTSRTSICTRRSASRTVVAGRGVGPVAVRAHLAPYLPNHPLRPEAGPATGVGRDRFGAVGLGGHPADLVGVHHDDGRIGLLDATRVAILNANYVAPARAALSRALHGRTGSSRTSASSTCGRSPRARGHRRRRREAAHRLRLPRTDDVVPGGRNADDRADGSEDRLELDRFCDALIAIRAEIDRVQAGDYPRDDNPLHGAPHPAADVVADDWNHAYSREEAAFPVAALRVDKYWPPVSRIDNALRRPQRRVLVPADLRLRRLTLPADRPATGRVAVGADEPMREAPAAVGRNEPVAVAAPVVEPGLGEHEERARRGRFLR